MTDEQIRELFGEVPYFADRVIKACRPEPDERLFTASSYWSDQASINLLDVCGTSHPDYAGLTWREFLTRGRRMEGNLRDFRNNPGYYTEERKRAPSMFFRKLDGQTYVTDDGHHRTCIGKFYLYAQGHPYIHGVHIDEIVIDRFFMSLYMKLDEIKPNDWRIRVQRENTGREDGPGWKRDGFSLKAACSVKTHDTAGDWLWSAGDLEKELPELERQFEKRRCQPVERVRGKGLWGRFFGKAK